MSFFRDGPLQAYAGERAFQSMDDSQGAAEPALYGQLTMATLMSRLLEEVSRDHFPYSPATLEEIEEFEQRQCGQIAQFLLRVLGGGAAEQGTPILVEACSRALSGPDDITWGSVWEVARILLTGASRSLARSLRSVPPHSRFLFIRPAASFPASFTSASRSGAPRFPSFAVACFRVDFEPAHLGRQGAPGLE